jgi:hypothetical protein
MGAVSAPLAHTLPSIGVLALVLGTQPRRPSFPRWRFVASQAVKTRALATEVSKSFRALPLAVAVSVPVAKICSCVARPKLAPARALRALVHADRFAGVPPRRVTRSTLAARQSTAQRGSRLSLTVTRVEQPNKSSNLNLKHSPRTWL